MTDMIERVARALFEQTLPPEDTWEAVPLPVRRGWYEAARAAIEAMREPTAQMVVAAYSALDAYDIATAGACTVRCAHIAMIDASLSAESS